MAYLKLIANPSDEEAFRRAIGVPKRGIGDTTVDVLAARSRATGVSLSEVAAREDLQESLRPAARKALADFTRLISALRERARDTSVDVLIQELIAEIRYVEYLQAEGPESARDRIENVSALIDGAAETVIDDGGEVFLHVIPCEVLQPLLERSFRLVVEEPGHAEIEAALARGHGEILPLTRRSLALRENDEAFQVLRQAVLHVGVVELRVGADGERVFDHRLGLGVGRILGGRRKLIVGSERGRGRQHEQAGEKCLFHALRRNDGPARAYFDISFEIRSTSANTRMKFSPMILRMSVSV